MHSQRSTHVCIAGDVDEGYPAIGVLQSAGRLCSRRSLLRTARLQHCRPFGLPVGCRAVWL